MTEYIQENLKASIAVKQAMLADNELMRRIEDAAAIITGTLRGGGRLVLCGNGGSAADAQHIAAELSGRYAYDRPPLDAEALHVNTSYLTAVANDYDFATVYARMVLARGRPGDALIAISTSGNSPNIVHAAAEALKAGLKVIGMTGRNGGELSGLCHILLNMPSDETPRIQEAHILCGHILCGLTEHLIFPKK